MKKAALVPVVLLACTGCYMEVGDGRHVERAPYYYVPTSNVPTALYIDTDLGIDAVPGDGVGVLVEYVSGGSWHVRTVCDTLYSGQPCDFVVYGQALSGVVSGLRPSDSSGPDDALGTYAFDTVSFWTSTSMETDGAWFETDPGASVEFTTRLDGIEDDLLSWRSGGAVVPVGYAASPVTLTPAAP